MNLRALTLLVAGCSLFLNTSCAHRYQDLLRDRDAEIRELNGDLADLRAENANLSRREQSALSRASDLESRPTEATPPPNELDSLVNELPDVNVRYNNSGQLSLGINNRVAFDSGSTKARQQEHAASPWVLVGIGVLSTFLLYVILRRGRGD